jgi:hypothetical protein
VEWSIPEIVGTSEKHDNVPGGVSCRHDDAIPNNSKKKACGWSAREGGVLEDFEDPHVREEGKEIAPHLMA